MFCGPLKGIKVEKKGFWYGDRWISTSAKVIIPKGSVTFNKLVIPYLRDRQKAKAILERNYQESLAKLYSENFPDFL